MNISKSIKFETYGWQCIIVSCTNVNTGIRIPKMPATILKNLIDNIDEDVDKNSLCEKIWGNSSYFTKRSFDVHLNKVKKLLKGSGYTIITSKGKLGLFNNKTLKNE